MSQWKPSPPQGFTREQSLIIIGRPPIPQFAAPQGSVGAPPPISGDTMIYEDLDIMAYGIDWMNSQFLQRIPLTINGGQVPSTQNNFPLLINDTYSDLIGEVEAELRFAGSDNIQLEYEIIKFDNGSGELIAWVKKPTVSDGDALNIYFDNTGASDEQNSAAVWSDRYNRVYHLHEDALDSTINAEDLTINSNTSLGFVSGKIGNAYNFPGGDVLDYMIQNPVTVFPTIAFTVSYWIKTTGNGDGMVSYAISAANNNELLVFDQANLRVLIGEGQVVIGDSFNNGLFRKVDLTWNNKDGFVLYYLDGNLVTTTISVNADMPLLNEGSLVLGQDQDAVGGGFQAAQALDGDMEEISLSENQRSADYIKTAFNNQNDNSAFYTTGTLESVPPIVDTMVYES